MIVKVLRNFKFNSVFTRMLLVTFGIFFTLCLINFIGIKVLTQKALNNEKQNSEFYVDYSCSYVQKLIQKMDEYMYSIEYDNNVVFLRTLPKKSNYAQNYKEITDTMKRLSIFRSLVDEISNVYIYLPNIDRILTSDGVYEPKIFFSQNYKGSFEAWKKLLTAKYSYTLNIWGFETSHGKFSKLNIIKTFYEGREAKCIIVANLDPNLLNKLFQGNNYASNKKFYITDSNHMILSSNIPGEIGKPLDTGSLFLKNKVKGSFYDNNYLISYQYLPDNDIYFIMMTPKEIIFKNVNNITFAAYLILAVMLIAGLLLSFFFSQKLYLPVGQMLKDMERFAAITMGLHNRQNEYEFIKNNINIIYSNNKKLESTIQQSMPFILDIIVIKLLQGGIGTGNAAILANQYNIVFKEGYYIAALLKCSYSFINMPQKQEAELNILVKNCISAELFSVLRLKDDEIVIVTYIENKDLASPAVERLSQLPDQLHEAFEDKRFYLGIGNGVECLDQIDVSYHGAQRALNERKVRDDEKVFFSESPKLTEKENKIYVPAEFEEKYKNAVYAGNLNISEDLVFEILECNYTRNISFLTYFKACSWLLSIMERIIDNSNGGLNQGISREVLENVDTAGDVIELNERLVRNNRLLCTAFYNEVKNETVLTDIVKYVDVNYNKNINLDTVANEFGYNSSYLSRLFKQAKGVSFSDYLGRKKIECAKMLLSNQKKTIKEIAEESGYNSTGVLIKAFEKSEGISPGEYRKRKSNEKNIK